MRTWRLLLQIIGALNLALASLGCCAETLAAMSVVRHPRVDPHAPFFPAAFWTMSAIDATLLVAFIIVSLMLLRLRPKAAFAHTCLFVVLVIYAYAPGLFWLLPYGVGYSIASASGLADVGIGVLVLYPVPFLYPLISTGCVNIARYQLKLTGSDPTPAIRHI
jgi:hypothetical protein